MARAGRRGGKQGQLRIIGGQWRGRKLAFPATEGLRPTTDRVRETLFNWLAPHLRDSRCADLFAGSGALGLEALSRGALYCDFVDTSGPALRQIRAHLETLDATRHAACHALSAQQFLQMDREPYDIVFIDPPFGAGLAGPTCALLDQRRLLAEEALVYLETAANEPCPQLPRHWSAHREKTAGGVSYRLFLTG
jgi:16S rRNA (guanine966-N2)-methyltransferase